MKCRAWWLERNIDLDENGSPSKLVIYDLNTSPLQAIYTAGPDKFHTIASKIQKLPRHLLRVDGLVVGDPWQALQLEGGGVLVI